MDYFLLGPKFYSSASIFIDDTQDSKLSLVPFILCFQVKLLAYGRCSPRIAIGKHLMA